MLKHGIISVNQTGYLMLKTLLAIIFLVTSLKAWSVGTVRLNSDTAPTVQAFQSTSLDLVTDAPNSNGTVETDPAEVYVPISSTAGANANFNKFSAGTANILPTITSGTVTFNVTVANHAREFFEMGVEDNSGDWKAVDFVSDTITGKPDGTYAITVNISQICAQAGTELDCNNVFQESDTAVTEKSTLLYLFFNGSNLVAGNAVNTGTTGGIYYNFNMSNRIDSTNKITLSELRKGDSQLTAVYQGFNYNELYQVYGFDYNTNSGQEDENLATASGNGTNYLLDSAVSSGEAKIKGLQNDRAYNFAVYFVDKYNFATLFSNVITARPQQIEALLEKNACFLLTAGFAGDHPLVDYFRSWRDQVLSKNFFGKMFINLYYEWGPKMAPVVLSHPWLAKSVRGSAHAVHWVLETRIWLVIMVFAIGLCLGTLMIALNRKEGAHPWQVTVSSPILSTEKGPKTQNAEKSFPNS